MISEDVLNSKTVMIVEDNVDLCFLLSSILTHYGVKTKIASGGIEAWAQLASGILPDLIVTDLTMPGMSGNILIDKIQHDARTSGIPVILSSAHTNIASQAKLLGVQGSLSKPYSVAKVIELVNSFIGPRPTSPEPALAL